MAQRPTLIEVLRMGTDWLGRRGSASARLDAELLTARALGLRRLDLYLQHDRPLEDAELQPVRALLRRRAEGEPVAYLLGEREFYGRPFTVSPAVLIPRPDTETLVEAVLRYARTHPAGQILDLGTGSGCIAVTLAAELPGAQVTAVDVSPDAVAVATGNAQRHDVGDRVRTLTGSWTDPVGDALFDVVVSNPPYITAGEIDSLAVDVRDHEPRLALVAGEDGLDAYRALAAAVPAVLRSPGCLALEVDPRRVDAVCQLVQGALPGAATDVVRDLAGHARVVVSRLH